MAERTQDARTVTAGMIYDETSRTRLVAQEVLDRLTPEEDGEPDPMDELLTALREVLAGQATILRRLDAIERRLDASRPPPGSGTR